MNCKGHVSSTIDNRSYCTCEDDWSDFEPIEEYKGFTINESRNYCHKCEVEWGAKYSVSLKGVGYFDDLESMDKCYDAIDKWLDKNGECL